MNLLKVFKIFLIILGLALAFASLVFSKTFVLDYEYKKALKKCENNKNRGDIVTCSNAILMEATKNISAVKAIEYAQELNERNDINQCHLQAHNIGKANLKKYNYDTGRALGTCGMGCRDGCFHGVMEEYALINKNAINSGKEVISLCSSVKSNEALYFHCIHGVGHGLLKHNTNAVIDVLRICTDIEKIEERNSCTQGVIMEYTSNYMELSEDAFKTQIPIMCKDIETTQNKDLIEQCYESIGERTLFLRTNYDIEYTKKICNLLDGEKAIYCINGANKEIKFQNLKPNE